MNNEIVGTNKNNEEQKGQSKRALNSCAKKVTRRMLEIPYSTTTVANTLEMRNMAKGFLRSLNVWDEVLEDALSNLHYSYTINNCSTEDFEEILRNSNDKLSLDDYESKPLNEVIILVRKFAQFIGFSNIIAPGRHVVDFWNIIKYNPSVLGSYLTVEELESIVSYSGDFGNFIMNDIRLIISNYLDNILNRVNVRQYVLLKEVSPKGYDIYITDESKLGIDKESAQGEIRYYMSQLAYDKLTEDDLHILGNLRRVYKLKIV
ncbi:hypothetical protein UT300012_24560 [Paraclostridium bifermentans]